MLFSDSLRKIMATRGYTQQALADAVSVSQSSIASMLRKNNPSVDALCKYLSVMGYDIALVPTGSKLPDGSYVLEPSRKEPSHEA